MAYLADVAGFALAAVAAAAVVATGFAGATAGVFARDELPRGHVGGPVGAVEAGHTGIAEGAAAGRVGAAEVGRQFADRLAEAGALGVASGILADGLVRRAGKLHPLGTVGAAGPEVCFVDAEGFSGDALRDGYALAVFAGGAGRADGGLAVTRAVGFAALDAVTDTDRGVGDAHVREADAVIQLAPLQLGAVGIVEAFYAFVDVNVAYQTGGTVLGALTRNRRILTEMVDALLTFGTVVIGDALNAEIEFVVTDEVLRAGRLNVAGEEVLALVGHTDAVVALAIFVALDADKPVGMAKAGIAIGVGIAGRIGDGITGDIKGDYSVPGLNIKGGRLVETVDGDGFAPASPSRARTARKEQRSQYNRRK